MSRAYVETWRRVLIVEDDQSLRNLLYRVFAGVNIDCDVANDGQEAIDALVKRAYSVVLLDLMLPKLSGYNVLQYIGNSAKTPRPMVFVMTAHADEFLRRVDPNVIDGIIRKPFQPEEVLQIVEQALARVGLKVGASETVLDGGVDPDETVKT